MTSYSREIIRDLVSGTLPWHQTKRIMSAYTDDARFFKMVAVLQARVKWTERILPPIGEHLFIVQKARAGDEVRMWARVRRLPEELAICFQHICPQG